MTATPRAPVQPTYLQYRAAALGFFIFVCGSNTATPLYPLWQQQMSASNAMTSAVFSIYPFGVVAGLLFGGRIADQIGRRPVMAVALAVGLAATVLFLLASRIEHLLAGRALFGVAMGLISGPSASTLIELHPLGDRRRGSWQAAITTLVAPVFGIIPASVFIWASPTLDGAVIITFSLQFVTILVCMLLLIAVPESFPGPTRLRWREANYAPQRIAVPRHDLRAFFLACAGGAISYSATSTWLGLGPSFILNILHWDNKLSGLLVLVPLVTGGIIQVACQRMPIRRALRLGLALVVLGFGVVAISLLITSIPIFLVGIFIAGAAVGFSWMGTAELTNRVAPAEQRASIFSFLYIVGYLTSSLAIWASGLAADAFGFVSGALLLVAGVAASALALLVWDVTLGPANPK